MRKANQSTYREKCLLSSRIKSSRISPVKSWYPRYETIPIGKAKNDEIP